MTAVKCLSNKNGLTLIETLTATLIMVLFLLGVGAAIGAQYYFINQNRESVLATLAAQEVIEKIRGMDFTSIINTDLNAKFNDPDDSRPEALSYLTVLDINVTKTTDDVCNDPDNIRRISVIIRWNSAGKVLRRSLFTVVTYKGIDNK